MRVCPRCSRPLRRLGALTLAVVAAASLLARPLQARATSVQTAQQPTKVGQQRALDQGERAAAEVSLQIPEVVFAEPTLAAGTVTVLAVITTDGAQAALEVTPGGSYLPTPDGAWRRGTLHPGRGGRPVACDRLRPPPSL